MGRRGFSLVELMIAVAALGILAALVAPAMIGAIEVAKRTACASNLHQLGIAMHAYLRDHDGQFFPLRESEPDGVLWYFGFEPSGSPARGEGNRILDRTRAKLYPYLESPETVEVCPSVPFGHPYKPKYRGQPWTYGINYELSYHTGSRNISEVRPQDASQTVVFADSAQVVTWIPPASAQNPMMEDWYYIRSGERTVQFRHGGRANVLFADWHVEAIGPAPGSFDPRLPEARIGYFDSDQVLLVPRGGR